MFRRMRFSWELPPSWVVGSARDALKKTNKWSDYYEVLAAFYGVTAPKVMVSEEKVKKSAVSNEVEFENVLACYYRKERTVYSPGQTMDEQTALHAFMHHLLTVHRIVPRKEAEEALCRQFASGVLKYPQ